MPAENLNQAPLRLPTIELSSWGRQPRQSAEVRPWIWASDLPPWGGATVLAYGLGRSYGDSCLNDGGTLVPTRALNHLVAFDATCGVITCEAGMTLDEILQFAVPRGWFPPTVPGTKFVTVGGAIANDIHGKNHHRSGTFGRHILWLDLVRSDGQQIRCSMAEAAELYRATIGGLGLTGCIARAAIQLRPITTAKIDVISRRFNHVDEFFEIAKDADQNSEYTVAWVDCLARGKDLGRGIFMAGNHATGDGQGDLIVHGRPKWVIPVDAPRWALNRWSVALFNECYFRRHGRQPRNFRAHYDPFFFPLDSIHQCRRPGRHPRDA
jgi:FAD/FMN-containing dehydrogenase